MQRKEVKEIRCARRGQATFEERDKTVSNTAVKILHNYNKAKNTFHERKTVASIEINIALDNP